MRKIFTVFILLVGLNSFLNAATYYSIASGNWTNATGTVWSTTSGGTAITAGDYPQKGDVVYLEGHTVVLDYDLSSQPGIELYVDVNSNLTGTGTEGILIKAGGALQVQGYLEVLSIDLKQGASVNLASTGTIVTSTWLTNDANIVVDGTLDIGTTFTNTGTVTGTGSITAATYSGTGTIFGIVANTITAGSTVGGATWDGDTSSDWNTATNWANGAVPDNTYNVVITVDGFTPITTGSSRSAKSITINSGAILTIAPGADLTVAEDITNNAGNTGLVIQSDATGDGSLIFGTGTLDATVQRYITKNKWHLVAPITEPSTANNFYLGAANLSWLAEYNETNNEYDYITDENASLSRAKGYSYWILDGQGDQTINFTGTLISADVIVPVTKNGAGWNLIGNPFSSALDWSLVSNAGNTTGIAYIWDNDLSGYLYSTGGSVGVGNIPGDKIPLGQGFLVEATESGSITIPATAKAHSTASFIKSTNNGKDENSQFIRIDLDGGYYGNTVFVGFPENGTDDFDIGGDATKLYSSTENVQLFAVENNDELCINANTPLTEGESKIVPLNMVQVTDGDYTLDVSDLDQLKNITIVLEDLKTGTTQDLRTNPSYTFNATAADDPGRLLLHFTWSPNSIGDIEKEADSDVSIYAYGKNVYINTKGDALNTISELRLYDIYGRKIMEQSLSGQTTENVSLNINNVYVIVKVVNGNQVYTEIVFIK